MSDAGKSLQMSSRFVRTVLDYCRSFWSILDTNLAGVLRALVQMAISYSFGADDRVREEHRISLVTLTLLLVLHAPTFWLLTLSITAEWFPGWSVCINISNEVCCRQLPRFIALRYTQETVCDMWLEFGESLAGVTQSLSTDHVWIFLML